MDIYQHPLYKEDIQYVAGLKLPWDKLKNKSILISGGTGLIGSFLVDLLTYKNEDGLNCRIFIISRNMDFAHERFKYCWDDPKIAFINQNVNLPFHIDEKIDYCFHLASNTHPIAYSTDPIGTITTNIIGLKNMLDIAAYNNVDRFVFTSSNEIYGENRGDVEFIGEDYCGYINCNTLRAGYTESKRCGEALCQAYKSQKGLKFVIPRLTRSYGPTLLSTDSKALSQFIQMAIAGKDIVLKSDGTQYYSYTYVADAVSGLLTVTLKGNNGEVYNVADETGVVKLKDLAYFLSKKYGKKVVYDIPNEIEKAGYSVVRNAALDGTKIKTLGWSMKYSIDEGLERTIHVMKDLIESVGCHNV